MANVFFSYSHADEALRDQLHKHLALLRHQGKIDAWYDRDIAAGDEIDGSILENLNSADIILLLISHSFISSEYCFSREMERAMERHASGEARVVPIILHHCDWMSAKFGKLKALPKDARTVTSWPDINEAFTDIALELRKIVESVSATPRTAPQRSPVLSEITRHPGDFSSLPGTFSRPFVTGLPREYTDLDKNKYQREGFEYICTYFENAIKAVKEDDASYEGEAERIDTRTMAATIWRNGAKKAECRVALDSGYFRGITFSDSTSGHMNSCNENLTTESDQEGIFFRAMMVGFGQQSNRLSHEDAAEHLWKMFIRTLSYR